MPRARRWTGPRTHQRSRPCRARSRRSRRTSSASSRRSTRCRSRGSATISRRRSSDSIRRSPARAAHSAMRTRRSAVPTSSSSRIRCWVGRWARPCRRSTEWPEAYAGSPTISSAIPRRSCAASPGSRSNEGPDGWTRGRARARRARRDGLQAVGDLAVLHPGLRGDARRRAAGELRHRGRAGHRALVRRPAGVRRPGDAESRRGRRVQPLGRPAGRKHRARRGRRPRDAARDTSGGGGPGGKLRCRLPGDYQRPALRLDPRARGSRRGGVGRAQGEGRSNALGPDGRAGAGRGPELRRARRRAQPRPRRGEQRHCRGDPRGSGRETVGRRMLPKVALLLVSLLAPAVARGQQPPTPPEAASASQAAMPDLGKGAEEVAAQLRQLTESLSDIAAFNSLEAEVADDTHRAAVRWSETGNLLNASLRPSALDSLESSWQALRRQLEDVRERIDERARRRTADLETLAKLHESWARALDLAQKANAPAPVLERAQSTVAANGAVRTGDTHG